MLIEVPEKLLPYVKWGNDTINARDNLPEELKPLFLEFKQHVTEIHKARYNEIMEKTDVIENKLSKRITIKRFIIICIGAFIGVAILLSLFVYVNY